MTEKELERFLNQNRIIQADGHGILFWKCKDGGYEADINDRCRLKGIDSYRFDDGKLVFYAGDKPLLTTEAKTDDLYMFDELIGRVFNTPSGKHMFVFARDDDDLYHVMVFYDDDDDSEYAKYAGEELHRLWSDRKIIGVADADASADVLYQFLQRVVKPI